MPTGKLSVNRRFVASTALKLLSMVKVKVTVCPGTVVSGKKVFQKPGAVFTINVALAGSIFWKFDDNGLVTLS